MMRPDMLPPAGPGEDSPAGSSAGSNRNGGNSTDDEDELEIDGDATVLVSPSDLSAKEPSRSSSALDRRPAAMIITD